MSSYRFLPVSRAESDVSKPLEFTGERFTPECAREIWYEHYHRYAFAHGLVGGLKVLDADCGEGYGAALLASAASSVTGVDVSEAAIAHARQRYRSDRLEYVVSDCLALPFPDDDFDCIVSFETLEHLEDQQGLLAEFRRVLRPNGFLLISTPDRAVYTDRQKNENPYHLRELYRPEFEALLAGYFPSRRLWGQKLLFQSAIWSLETRSGVSLLQSQGDRLADCDAPPHDPVYLLALCGADDGCLPAPATGLSLFDDAAESVYEHYYHEIRKNMAAGELLAEKDRQLDELREQLAQTPVVASWWRRLLGRQ